MVGNRNDIQQPIAIEVTRVHTMSPRQLDQLARLKTAAAKILEQVNTLEKATFGASRVSPLK